MDYQEEEKEDKRYKKQYSRKDFKKDVAEAVEPLVKGKAPKSKPKKGRKQYEGMSAAALRKLLNEKKKALLVKSGFPDGKIPRGKDAMISLCVKLKRKRW